MKKISYSGKEYTLLAEHADQYVIHDDSDVLTVPKDICTIIDEPENDYIYDDGEGQQDRKSVVDKFHSDLKKELGQSEEEPFEKEDELNFDIITNTPVLNKELIKNELIDSIKQKLAELEKLDDEE